MSDRHARARTREQIPAADRWDLQPIFAGWAQWEEALERLQGILDGFPHHRGTLVQGAGTLLRVLREHDEMEILLQRVWWYASLMHDEDLRRNDVGSRKQRASLLMSSAQTATAWLRPEILALGEDRVREWLGTDAELELYHFHLVDLFRQQEHVLDEPRETLLSYSDPLSQSPRDAYSMLCTADVRWPTIELSSGEQLELTYGAYHRVLATEPVQEDRRRAFQALYETFAANRNTYAALYGAVCHRDWFHARSRGYASTLEAALHGDDIPVSVVENLIASTRAGAAPLRRYYELRRRTLGLREFHLYDAFVPLVDSDPRYSYEEAVGHVLESVGPLGEDYRARMERAFAERWIDVYENEGKRSGAYSAAVYGVHPYMLLNYQGTRSDMFTLGHEMGHSMHTVLSHENQPFVYAHYTIFVAEVASTLNEALLLDHLLAHTDDPRERILLVQHAIDSIASTFYTQVLFADFELRAHREIEADRPLTADGLEEIYGGLMDDYYGDAVTKDPLYRTTWARIPHLYRSPYYVYQYATCFASAATLTRSMTGDDDQERVRTTERYLELLRSGGSAHPMEQLRRAGVDLDRPQTIEAVIARMEELVDVLERDLVALDPARA